MTGMAKHYFLGHSNGLQPKAAKVAVNKVLQEWKAQGVESFSEKDRLAMDLRIARKMAPLVGALPHEIAFAATLTSNVHCILAPFYKP